MADLRRTSKFTENYELKEQLGIGGFAVVRRCVNKTSGEQFAAKIIDTSKLKTQELMRLEREAQICRQLSHDNIVKLKDSILEERYYYLVIELVSGGELFDEIVSRKNYSEDDASFCMKQVLDGIVYCHDKHIVHRDIKPENLLLDSKIQRAVIKLTDFGLSFQLKDDGKHWYGFAGTPGYMAPEIIKRLPYGKAIDVFSCGVVLYILLCGFPPFWDKDKDKLMKKIARGRYTYPSPEWDGVSKEAKDLIDMMMAPDQDARITSADALKHPWITKREEVASKLHRQATVNSIMKLNARTKVRGIVDATLLAARRFFFSFTGKSKKPQN